jgi:hypothetical protein
MHNFVTARIHIGQQADDGIDPAAARQLAAELLKAAELAESS